MKKLFKILKWARRLRKIFVFILCISIPLLVIRYVLKHR